MPRPYTSAAQYTAEAKSIGFMSCLKESGGGCLFYAWIDLTVTQYQSEISCNASITIKAVPRILKRPGYCL